MDQNTRASGHPIEPEDEGESTQIFGQKMNAIFSSLAPPGGTLPPPEHDLAGLLDDDLLAPRSSQLPPAPLPPLPSAPVGRVSSPGFAPYVAPTAPPTAVPLATAPPAPLAVPSSPEPVMAGAPPARLSAPLPATASATSRRPGWVPALVVLLLLGVGVLAWGYLRAP